MYNDLPVTVDLHYVQLRRLRTYTVSAKRINVNMVDGGNSFRGSVVIVVRITTHLHLHTYNPGGCLARRMVCDPRHREKTRGRYVNGVKLSPLWAGGSRCAILPAAAAALCAHQIRRRYLSRR